MIFGYGRQSISSEDVDAVVDVLKSDFLTQGPKIQEFENAICEYTKAKYCVVILMLQRRCILRCWRQT